jgi:hypothetical protein
VAASQGEGQNRSEEETYAYNHEEAIVCFQKALEEDPECAIAHWGIAYGVHRPELVPDAGRCPVKMRGF